jgi:hypothetical protein
MLKPPRADPPARPLELVRSTEPYRAWRGETGRQVDPIRLALIGQPARGTTPQAIVRVGPLVRHRTLPLRCCGSRPLPPAMLAARP